MYPPESNSNWKPRPVPHPLAASIDAVAASAVAIYKWATEAKTPPDHRPYPAHLHQPGWKR